MGKADVRYQSGYGITGVKMYSMHSDLTDDHGGGYWLNHGDRVMAERYEAYAGVQVRDDGWGLTNLRWWCVPKEIKHIEIAFDLLYHLDRDPGGRFSVDWQIEVGTEEVSSSNTELADTVDLSIGMGFESKAFTANMGLTAEMKEVTTKAAKHVTTQKEIRSTHIDWDLNKPLWLYQVIVTTKFVDDDVMVVKGPVLSLSEALAQTSAKLGRFIREPDGWVMWEEQSTGYTVGSCSMCPGHNLCENYITVSAAYLHSLTVGPPFTCDQIPTSPAALQNTTAVI